MLSVEKNIKQLSDELLIWEYQQTGERELVGELYSRYHHLAFGTCLKFLKNREESSDLVVEIFEKLLHKLSTEQVQHFNSWLYALCKNECISYIRRQAAQRNRRENWAEEEKRPEIFMENEALLRLCEEELSQEEEEEAQNVQVRAALKKLPREQRLCLTLFYFKEKSYQQIAEKTQFSLLQVKSYLQNGKRNLKKLLQEEIP